MSFTIQTEDLSKHFRNVKAVDRLNLEIPKGGIFAVVGPNGAGKTTAIKLLMNILRPTAGRAEILGVDSRGLAPEQLARIGYVSENQQLPGWMKVGYFLSYLKPFYPTWDDTLARELTGRFDLPLDRKLRHLSRGMRMKAALASSLAYHPELIVLDEPFTGIDALVRDELIESTLEGAERATILIASHDLAEIESFASHVAYIEHGRVHFAEEMALLTARFREVEVTLEEATDLPPDWPEAWLNPRASAAVVRFVDSQFDQERTTREIRRVFGRIGEISCEPMPLRSIFVSLAKPVRASA